MTDKPRLSPRWSRTGPRRRRTRANGRRNRSRPPCVARDEVHAETIGTESIDVNSAAAANGGPEPLIRVRPWGGTWERGSDECRRRPLSPASCGGRSTSGAGAGPASDPESRARPQRAGDGIRDQVENAQRHGADADRTSGRSNHALAGGASAADPGCDGAGAAPLVPPPVLLPKSQPLDQVLRCRPCLRAPRSLRGGRQPRERGRAEPSPPRRQRSRGPR